MPTTWWNVNIVSHISLKIDCLLRNSPVAAIWGVNFWSPESVLRFLQHTWLLCTWNIHHCSHLLWLEVFIVGGWNTGIWRDQTDDRGGGPLVVYSSGWPMKASRYGIIPLHYPSSPPPSPHILWAGSGIRAPPPRCWKIKTQQRGGTRNPLTYTQIAHHSCLLNVLGIAHLLICTKQKMR